MSGSVTVAWNTPLGSVRMPSSVSVPAVTVSTGSVNGLMRASLSVSRSNLPTLNPGAYPVPLMVMTSPVAAVAGETRTSAVSRESVPGLEMKMVMSAELRRSRATSSTAPVPSGRSSGSSRSTMPARKVPAEVVWVVSMSVCVPMSNATSASASKPAPSTTSSVPRAPMLSVEPPSITALVILPVTRMPLCEADAAPARRTSSYVSAGSLGVMNVTSSAPCSSAGAPVVLTFTPANCAMAASPATKPIPVTRTSSPGVICVSPSAVMTSVICATGVYTNGAAAAVPARPLRTMGAAPRTLRFTRSAVRIKLARMVPRVLAAAPLASMIGCPS